ncbi:MAG: LPXTG cell wall anchor domain-containing protein, partial [Clostridia bacterium]|nr:LPXTG cell wall anchor domain-containing protein [Clostridia bacterium]
TITEAEAEGFTVTKDGDTGTISTTPSEAVFTNTRIVGGLTVSKVLVSDAAADKDALFNFTITLSDATINKTYGDVAFVNGVATIVLKGGESATISGLPTGIGYTITEAEAEGFTVTKDGDTGTISTTPSTAEFTNTRNTSGLTVKKVVVSDASADMQKEFSFTVTLADKTINGAYGDMTFENGVAEFTLKANESKTASGLPTGMYYVTEAEDGDFTTSWEGQTGTIGEEMSLATATNTRNTGDLTISKTVISDAAADADAEFTFTVTLSDTTINKTYGEGDTAVTFTNGVATIVLKGGESATISGLPTGIGYTITEAEAEGFIVTKDGDTGTISTTPSEAVFTNTRIVGGLTVSKVLISSVPADADVEFTFTVTLSDTTISGAYGDMTFVDGVATFTIKGGESKTAAGLPEGVAYTVTEAEAEGFTLTGVVGDSGTISGTMSTVEFTNARNTGDLDVSKTVESTVSGDMTREFTFIVTLDDTTISGTFGGMTFENGVATFTLKHGETMSATGLPAGVAYTVEEETAAGFVVTKIGETGVISETKSIAVFTNLRETGGLSVRKTVVSSVNDDMTREFTFTVTLDDTTINGTYGDMTFVDGVATFTLKHGETKTASGLPEGVSFAVAEQAEDGFTVTTEGSVTGGITTDASADVHFINTRITGGLSVHKTITGTAADMTRKFTFRVTLSDTTINGVFGDMTFVSGVATFMLGHDESASAVGLPAGVTYIVEELDSDDYIVEINNPEGVIDPGSGAVVQFVNKRNRNDLPQTGDDSSLAAYAALLAMSSAMMLYMACRKRRA